jgi:hypothetical protein
VQTPRFCGQACIAGVFDFLTIFFRLFLTNWFSVGMLKLLVLIPFCGTIPSLNAIQKA